MQTSRGELNSTLVKRSPFWSRWFSSRFGKNLSRNQLAVTGFILVALFILIAVFAPLLAPPRGDCLRDLTNNQASVTALQLAQAVVAAPASCYMMPKLGLASEPTPPSQLAPMGTVNSYDIRYGLVWGTRTALGLGIMIVFVNLLVGACVGVIAGYFGGRVDSALMRLTDIVYAFPSLILSIVLASLLGKGLINVAISFMLVDWAFYARMVRAEVLRVRNLEYVEASRALGVGSPRIMAKHILPNVAKPLLVVMVLDMGTIPLLISALSFLGIGAAPGFSDWGQLINLAQQWVQGRPGEPFAYWYVSLFPGLFILLYSLAWNFIGDALQETLDVRSK